MTNQRPAPWFWEGLSVQETLHRDVIGIPVGGELTRLPTGRYLAPPTQEELEPARRELRCARPYQREDIRFPARGEQEFIPDCYGDLVPVPGGKVAACWQDDLGVADLDPLFF